MLWTLVREISLECVEGRPRMLVAARTKKSLWLVTVFERCEARSATEATVEPPATMSRNQGAKITGRLVGFYRAEGWGREGYHIGR